MKKQNGENTSLQAGDKLHLTEAGGASDGFITISFTRGTDSLYFVRGKDQVDDKLLFVDKENALSAMNLISMITGFTFVRPQEKKGLTIYELEELG